MAVAAAVGAAVSFGTWVGMWVAVGAAGTRVTRLQDMLNRSKAASVIRLIFAGCFAISSILLYLARSQAREILQKVIRQAYE